MNGRYAALMVNVLHKEYPEIASIITKKINDSLPEYSLTDLQYIDQIVTSFKKEKGITHDKWTNTVKGNPKGKVTGIREEMVAVVLMFYHPEKLIQLTKERTRQGVITQLAKVTGAPNEVLSKSATNIPLKFRAYVDFRNEVYRLYELIKEENQFFK
jgi:hypothetical protein